MTDELRHDVEDGHRIIDPHGKMVMSVWVEYQIEALSPEYIESIAEMAKGYAIEFLTKRMKGHQA